MQEGRSFIVKRRGADKERQYKNAVETWRQMVYRSIPTTCMSLGKVKNHSQLFHLVKKACKETQIAQL